MDIANYLQKHHFDGVQSEIIRNHGEIQSFKKGDFFVTKGQISNRVGFILNGMFYAYEIDAQGNKKIFRFFYAPIFYLVVDYESYVRHKTSQFTIEALEDTQVLVFHKEQIELLYATMPEFARLYRYEVDQMLIRTLRVIRIFQKSNTYERMQLLKNTSPELFTRVPYSYLASYLGVHRNTFSEAMKRL
ncbi:MAG: Crp/Fnr family transcriptional regulator [Capnocytophaga sp.]|nr:Crp/Fnr family transcriptional regulator [Capnocytophaga sp.]